MASKKDSKTNPVIVGLLLVFLWPLGLAVMWLNGWAARTKAIITGVLLISAVLLIVVLASLSAAVHSVSTSADYGASNVVQTQTAATTTTADSTNTTGADTALIGDAGWPAVWNAYMALPNSADDHFKAFINRQVHLTAVYDFRAGDNIGGTAKGGPGDLVTVWPNATGSGDDPENVQLPSSISPGETFVVDGTISSVSDDPESVSASSGPVVVATSLRFLSPSTPDTATGTTATTPATKTTTTASTLDTATGAAAYNVKTVNGISVDAYCKELGYDHSGLAGAQVGPRAAYNNWRCFNSDGDPMSSVDMDSLCKATYPDIPMTARPDSPDDAYSWNCYTTDSSKANMQPNYTTDTGA